MSLLLLQLQVYSLKIQGATCFPSCLRIWLSITFQGLPPSSKPPNVALTPEGDSPPPRPVMTGISRVFLRRSFAVSLSLPPSGADAAWTPAASRVGLKSSAPRCPSLLRGILKEEAEPSPGLEQHRACERMLAMGSHHHHHPGLKNAEPRKLRASRLGLEYQPYNLRKPSWFLQILRKSRESRQCPSPLSEAFRPVRSGGDTDFLDPTCSLSIMVGAASLA